MTPLSRILYLRDVEKWRWRQIAQVMAPAGADDTTIARFENNARARYHAHKSVDRVKRPEATKKRTKRPCMRCRKPFWSTGSGHRMCDGCRKVAEDVSPFDPGVGGGDGCRRVVPHFDPGSK